MKSIARKLGFSMALALVLSLSASAKVNVERITVPKGTSVMLVFDQAISSKTVKQGASVKLHVKSDVKVGGKIVVRRGTRVTGVISQVSKRGRYGTNATLRLAVNPIKTTFYQPLTVQARSRGEIVGGKKSGQAAAATAGGAILLGPVGLAGGYFIHGKPVNIHPGELLQTEVSKTTALTRRIAVHRR